MTTWFALLALAAPLALLAVAALARLSPGSRPRRLLAVAQGASLGALAVAVASAVAVAVAGPLVSPLIGAADVGLTVRLDALSVTLLVLVAFVGAIVVRYARSYMDGDPRQGVFTGRLGLTLASVMLLVTGGNLIHLAVAWIATSVSLHGLLTFYAERPKAMLAARKKAVTARLGDVLLIGAVALLWSSFGTTDIGAILTAAEAMSGSGSGSESGAITAAAILLALAALLKSAQFPTHGWLPEVMEAPTPVSALLHAGIINAGGFLVIRFADVMLLSSSALHLLAVVGAVTALFGSVVMLTQTSVKASLAFSTVAQMGFMMLQCGLGLFPLAVLHIVAHSLYKAHAFLSSGSVVEIARASWVPDARPPRPAGVLAGVALALALTGGIGWGLGVFDGSNGQLLAMAAILVMGLTVLIAQATAGSARRTVVVRTITAAGAVTLAYFALHAASVALMTPLLPPPPAPTLVSAIVLGSAVAAFGVVTVLQIVAPSHAGDRFWRAARVHVANGFYVNALFDRLVGGLPARTDTRI